MEAITNFHFIRPGWLLLIPIAFILWWLWRRSSEPLRGWREQVDSDLLKVMTVDGTKHRGDTARWLLGGWIIAIIAIAGPTWKREPNPFAEDAAPLFVLLKADESMDRPGASPTPLERAQLKLADLAKVRKGQPIGLIVYAGSAHLVLPPTQDTTVVAEMASEVSSDLMPKPGDRLDLAIRKASTILAEEKEGGTLLVLADSVNEDPQSIVKAHQESGSISVQFLALRDDESLKKTASAIDASIVALTPDDEDVIAISKAAERDAGVGVGGESQRWEEMGYWLVPVLVILVAGSFRREKRTSEGQE